MTTRAKSGVFKPKALLKEITPRCTKDEMQDPQWLDTMKEEYMVLTQNKTWDLVPLPPHRKAIGSKWIYRLKYNVDGSVARHKARLVAQGYSQRPGLDYNETFSPVIKHVTIRTVLSIAVTRKWNIRQVDVNNAFLNGSIQEEVYMQQPEVFIFVNPHLVCKLKESLYGLKQAPRAWFSKLASSLISFGFKPTRCDTSLFVHATPKFITYILVYVDDIIITGISNSAIQYVISKLHSLYPLKDLGTLHFFLGIEAKHTTTGALLLSQSKYINDLLSKVNMHNAKPIKTPLAPGSQLHMDGTNSFSDPTLYRYVVGALQYATITLQT